MTLSGLSPNFRPRHVATWSPWIIYSVVYKGGRCARSDSKAAIECLVWLFGTKGVPWLVKQKKKTINSFQQSVR